MFVALTADVDDLRLTGPAGLLAAVMPDLGAELVARGDALELTRDEFQRRLEAETTRQNCACRVISAPVDS